MHPECTVEGRGTEWIVGPLSPAGSTWGLLRPATWLGSAGSRITHQVKGVQGMAPGAEQTLNSRLKEQGLVGQSIAWGRWRGFSSKSPTSQARHLTCSKGQEGHLGTGQCSLRPDNRTRPSLEGSYLDIFLGLRPGVPLKPSPFCRVQPWSAALGLRRSLKLCG